MTTWASRITDLQEGPGGLTLAEIAEYIGVAASTVGDLKTGRSTSPRGEAALKLDALHRLRCGSKPVTA